MLRQQARSLIARHGETCPEEEPPERGDLMPGADLFSAIRAHPFFQVSTMWWERRHGHMWWLYRRFPKAFGVTTVAPKST